MTRIALFGDLHANLSATLAAHRDLQRRGGAEIWVLGDLVGKGPRPAEVIDWTMASAARVIMGNWDIRIAGDSQRPQDIWPRKQLSRAQRSYLASLPYGIEEKLGGQWWRFVHASRSGLFERFYLDTSLKEKKKQFLPYPENGLMQHADALVYADLHEAFITTADTRPLINCGSVGNPLDSTLGSYLLLEFADPAWTATIVRFEYGRETEITVAEKSGMPFVAEYIHELRTGEYRKRRAK